MLGWFDPARFIGTDGGSRSENANTDGQDCALRECSPNRAALRTASAAGVRKQENSNEACPFPTGMACFGALVLILTNNPD